MHSKPGRPSILPPILSPVVAAGSLLVCSSVVLEISNRAVAITDNNFFGWGTEML